MDRSRRAAKTAKKLMDSEGNAIKSALTDLVAGAMSRLPASDSERDLSAILQLCVMASVPTGTENPKAILLEVSDITLDSLVRNFGPVSRHPFIGPVAGLLLIEWCWRNGHLEAEWEWKWDNEREGQARYLAPKTLDQILQESVAVC